MKCILFAPSFMEYDICRVGSHLTGSVRFRLLRPKSDFSCFLICTYIGESDAN